MPEVSFNSETTVLQENRPVGNSLDIYNVPDLDIFILFKTHSIPVRHALLLPV